MAKRKNKTNKDWNPALKAKAVKHVNNSPGVPMNKLAEQIGCSAQSLNAWLLADGGRKSASGLPVKKAAAKVYADGVTRKKTTKALVASGYSCPHCGESVEVPA